MTSAKSKSDFAYLLNHRERYSSKPGRFFFSRLYGIGKSRRRFLMVFTGINKHYSLKLGKIKRRIRFYYIDRFLRLQDIVYGFTLKRRRVILFNIVKALYNYKAMRKFFLKPCRGQRTKTNAATAPITLGLFRTLLGTSGKGGKKRQKEISKTKKRF